VWIRLRRSGDLVRLEIEDDGRGFEPTGAPDHVDANRGLGLRSMRERLALVGGLLTIESRTGAGARVVAELPLPAHQKAG
jgi:signal transduction histidine kinase